ncbi:MAG: 60S ribosomal protein L31, partial [Nitrosopumilus sp.]|nr:60S ribosomal protein L31 [Nitrosopumilus sp.]
MSAEERIHTINLGKVLLSQPQHRAVRAINMIREFARRHAGTEAVKIDEDLARRVWARGARSPPRRVRVMIGRTDDGDTLVSLYDGDLVPGQVLGGDDDAAPVAPDAGAQETAEGPPGDAPSAEPGAETPKPDGAPSAEPSTGPDTETPKPEDAPAAGPDPDTQPGSDPDAPKPGSPPKPADPPAAEKPAPADKPDTAKPADPKPADPPAAEKPAPADKP